VNSLPLSLRMWSGTPRPTNRSLSRSKTSSLAGGDGSFTLACGAAGDTNLDGVVDVLDLADFAGTGLFNAGPYAMPEAPMASLALPAAVPEPALGAGALVAVASGLPRRRQARPSRSTQRA